MPGKENGPQRGPLHRQRPPPFLPGNTEVFAGLRLRLPILQAGVDPADRFFRGVVAPGQLPDGIATLHKDKVKVGGSSGRGSTSTASTTASTSRYSKTSTR